MTEPIKPEVPIVTSADFLAKLSFPLVLPADRAAKPTAAQLQTDIGKLATIDGSLAKDFTVEVIDVSGIPHFNSQEDKAARKPPPLVFHAKFSFAQDTIAEQSNQPTVEDLQDDLEQLNTIDPALTPFTVTVTQAT